VFKKMPSLCAWVFERCDHVVCVNQDISEFVKNWMPAEKISVLPMGCSPEKFENVKSQSVKQRDDRKFTVGVIGRLDSIKGIDFCIAALSNNKKLSIELVGPGTENLNQDNVLGLGEQSHLATLARLKSWDALILPSRVHASGRTEGCPSVLLEAWALGVPIIASAVGGVLDLIRHEENGVLFESENEVALQQAVMDLIERPHHCRDLAVAGMESVKPYFWPQQAVQWQSLLDSVCGVRA
jgi:glycosyltransferase involved in cell wall biosynthesis